MELRPRNGRYNPPPNDPGEGWRELLPEETLTLGDEFWATARGCWVEIREPTTFGRPAIYLVPATKVRRRIDPASELRNTELKEAMA